VRPARLDARFPKRFIARRLCIANLVNESAAANSICYRAAVIVGRIRISIAGASRRMSTFAQTRARALDY
jgi:hypothetical protein